MDFGLFREIIDEASTHGARSFSLHLFGEPFLYPRLFDAIAYIKGRNKHHNILLTTNGTRINSNIDELVRSKVDQVFWTWRTEVRFKTITLLKLKTWGKFRVRFIDEITPKEAIEKWKNWGNLEHRSIHNYGGQIELSNYGVQNTVTKRWPCYHLWLAPAVSWNGNILLCCSDPHQKEVLGKFPEQSVAEVWQGSKLAEIRDSHLRGEYGGICKNCDVWKSYPDIHFKFQKKHS